MKSSHVAVLLLCALTTSALTEPVPAASLLSTTTGGIGAGTAIAGGVVMGTAKSNVKKKKLGTILLASGLSASVLFSSTGAVFLVLGYSCVDKLETEVAAGQGPLMDSLVSTLGVSRAELIVAFRSARERQPVVRNDGDAERFFTIFMHEMAPHIQISRETAGEFLNQLHRERRSPDFPTRAPAHAALAGWMGVPLEVAIQATARTLDEALAARARSGEVRSARATFYSEPEPVLEALASRIADGHEDMLHARLRVLSAATQNIDPTWSRELVSQYGL